HHVFGAAGGVHVGVVEEVHSQVVGAVEKVGSRRLVDLLAEGQPGSQRNLAQLQAAASHPSVVHLTLGGFTEWILPRGVVGHTRSVVSGEWPVVSAASGG